MAWPAALATADTPAKVMARRPEETTWPPRRLCWAPVRYRIYEHPAALIALARFARPGPEIARTDLLGSTSARRGLEEAPHVLVLRGILYGVVRGQADPPGPAIARPGIVSPGRDRHTKPFIAHHGMVLPPGSMRGSKSRREAEHRMQAGKRARRGMAKPWHSFVSEGKQIFQAGSSGFCREALGIIL